MKLFLDDIRMPEKVIGVGYTQWTIARTVAEAKRLIEAARANHEPIEAMTLDHDLGACEKCILDDRAIDDAAIVIKKADLYDNLTRPTPPELKGLKERYYKALEVLNR